MFKESLETLATFDRYNNILKKNKKVTRYKLYTSKIPQQ